MRGLGELLVGALLVLLWLTLVPSARAADFTVVNTNNSGSGSLREALTAANSNPGRDRMLFDIPGEGVRVIRLTNALPAIVDSLEIDGFSQPGSSPNTETNFDNAVRLIELDGGNQSFDGLVVSADGCHIRGLSVRRFASGVALQSSSNVIVSCLLGTVPLSPGIQTNLTVGNGYGVSVGGFCCSNVVVAGNRIGGEALAERNVVLANRQSAVRIGEYGAEVVRDTVILGNFIGVMPDGVRSAGWYGFSSISLRSAAGVKIGGAEAGAGNVLAAGFLTAPGFSFPPAGTAVSLRGAGVSDVQIIGNCVGVGADGASPLYPFQNIGVVAEVNGLANLPIRPLNLLITGNRFGYTDYGVHVSEVVNGTNIFSANRISVLSNTMTAMHVSSIYLGRSTAQNDPGDSDIGANDQQNHPVITDVVFTNGTTVIEGFLSSAYEKSYIVELFASSTKTSNGHANCEVFLERINLATDTNGMASFRETFPFIDADHRVISATATDADGNTSLVSPPLSARSAEPMIFVQPIDLGVSSGSTATFSVVASGDQPLSVGWRVNGLPITGATNFSLVITNARLENVGNYDVVLSNPFGVVTSRTARLAVGVRPIIVQHPISQTVASNQSITLSVSVSNLATLPLLYIWRSNSVIVATELSGERTAFYKTAPLKSTPRYVVVVSNALTAPVSSRTAFITMLADRDGDGLPDAFEILYALNPDEAADAQLDFDGDGLSNIEEYLSGTNPVDATNQLRIQRIQSDMAGALVEFLASSNKTYLLQYQDAVAGGSWLPLLALPARETNRMESVRDSESNPARFYRVITPSE